MKKKEINKGDSIVQLTVADLMQLFDEAIKRNESEVEENNKNYSVKTLAEYLGVCDSTIRKNLHKLPKIRIGRKIIFRKTDIDSWLEENRDSINSMG